MKTAVIYARYSCDQQTEQSIEGQLRVCEDYAKAHDILILDTYIDRAMTGTNDNRPDFQRMIKDSAKRQFQIVLVYKLDRFSRDKYATAVHKHTLKNNGVRLVSAMENIPDTPEGIILESLLEGMNQYYSAELSQKVKRGMKESRLKGNFTGGFLPYGYKVIDHKVLIDEERAEVVRFIYEQYSMGVYVKDIIAALTAKGVMNRGKQFATNTVYNILKCEKYSGIYRFNGEIFTDIYPQIVPQELYAKVRAKIEQNHYGKRSVEVVYLLRHKLTCGYCGQPISAECGTAKNGQRKHYYKCLGRKRGSDCKKSVMRKETLENIVIDTVVEELSKPEIMQSLINGLLDMQEQNLKENSCLTSLLKEKERAELTIDNIMSAIEQGVVTKTTTARLKELEARLEELEKQILIERGKINVRLTQKEIREYYEQALRLEPQMLINFLIKEIVLYDDLIEIQFNSPIRTSPDGDRGFCFYSNTANYPIFVQEKSCIVMSKIIIKMCI